MGSFLEKNLALPAFLVCLLTISFYPVRAEVLASGGGVDERISPLEALASDDPAVQEETLRGFAEGGDLEALPLLTALHEGSLHIWRQSETESRIVILITEEKAGGEELEFLVDPITREKLKEWDELEAGLGEELEMVSVVSSKGRRWLQAARDRLRLFSPTPEVRRGAATKIGNDGDLTAIPLLERALTDETDRWPRHAMEEAIYQIQLIDPDPEKRREAALKLGEIIGLQSLPRLQSLLSEDPQETDESVREGIAQAIDKIETYQDRQQIVGTLFSGLSLGSILLLMGLGLAIIFGLMGVINMAHGELMMIGAYTAFVLQELFHQYLSPSHHDLYFLFALPFSFIVTGLVGLVLEKSVIRFLYGRPLETLLATWGVSLIFQQAARWYFGDLTSVNAPVWMRGGAEVMVGLVLPYNRIFIIVLSLGAVSGIYFLLFRSRWGLRMRAVTQNRDMSACLGISTRKVDSWTFALGAGVAGLAGCAISLVGSVDPEMGKTYIVDSFMVVVVGGVGKLAGTVVSAMGIGMLNKILEPMIGGTGGAVYAKWFILAAIILFHQRKPSGFFPAKGRSVDST